MKSRILLLFLFLWVGMAACKKNTDIAPGENFTRIYDNGEFGGSFYPIDIIPVANDGGYVILGERRLDDSNFFGVYILKVDKAGNFEWEFKAPSTYVNPLPGIFVVNNEAHFFCMDRVSLQTVVMKVGDKNASVVSTIGRVYPLAVSRTTDQGFLLQSYDRTTLNTVLTKLSSSFAITWSTNHAVLEDAEELLVNHLTRIGTRLPFLTGENGSGGYFFNGFYNYTISMVMTNASGTYTGVLNGFRYNGSVSSAVNLGSNRYAISRFYFNDNFFVPQATISSSAVASANDLKGQYMTELNPSARVMSKRLNVGGKDVIIYATDTKSNQIVIYAYESQTGTLLGTKFLGYSNPYEVANFAITEDGGLAVVGTNYINGRFPRICLFKLAKSELNKLVGS
ncbi:MAG: hypothetical protein EAZ55_06850 [Cytophagales bacterium]|nr:MAG: hypothetical protein EAZ55_06850 [Cytophagales bacterium]